MSLNDKENEITIKTSHENCYSPDDKRSWCEKCVPCTLIEGWTSGNNDIDKFIKDTIYNAKYDISDYVENIKCPLFLEWVPFDEFMDIEQIGEGGFAKVYSTMWAAGNAKYIKQGDGSWKKLDPKPMRVALKRLNESQNISDEYLNELKAHWDLCNIEVASLRFYGMTKDPETKEFMMIMQFANKGNLRSVISSNFNNFLWEDKILSLYGLTMDLKNLHRLGYFHKDLHIGNILQVDRASYISDFGLSGPSNEPKSDDKIYGVLPYIAPEVLNGRSHTLSSDIYSVGIIMTELSSGKPPFHKRKHTPGLALEICGGLRPEFGRGTPEIYRKLAHKCMNAKPDQRPTANELNDILGFWFNSIRGHDQDQEKFGHKGKEINAIFKDSDKEIPNISSSYEKDPDAIYSSRAFKFNCLSEPINLSMYIDCQDSGLIDIQLSDINDEIDTDN